MFDWDCHKTHDSLVRWLAQETMEILEHFKRNFQARMIQWLQLVEISWFLMVWTSSWWKLQVQLSVYPSFQWISPEGRYFRRRRSTTKTVGSRAFRSGLIDKYCRIMLKSLKKLWSFDRATWFLRLESAGHSGLVQKCLDFFRIADTSHAHRQDFSLGGNKAPNATRGEAPKAPRMVECGEGVPPPCRGRGLQHHWKVH